MVLMSAPGGWLTAHTMELASWPAVQLVPVGQGARF
jgi:hypothetical protein